MRNIAYIFVVITFVFSSCSSEEAVDRPEWLNEKVNKIIVAEDLCAISSVTVYEYDNELYYNIYCNIWSCMYCYLYDGSGNVVNWDSETFEQFYADKKEVEEFNACDLK